MCDSHVLRHGPTAGARQQRCQPSDPGRRIRRHLQDGLCVRQNKRAAAVPVRRCGRNLLGSVIWFRPSAAYFVAFSGFTSRFHGSSPPCDGRLATPSSQERECSTTCGWGWRSRAQPSPLPRARQPRRRSVGVLVPQPAGALPQSGASQPRSRSGGFPVAADRVPQARYAQGLSVRAGPGQAAYTIRWTYRVAVPAQGMSTRMGMGAPKRASHAQGADVYALVGRSAASAPLAIPTDPLLPIRSRP